MEKQIVMQENMPDTHDIAGFEAVRDNENNKEVGHSVAMEEQLIMQEAAISVTPRLEEMENNYMLCDSDDILNEEVGTKSIIFYLCLKYCLFI